MAHPKRKISKTRRDKRRTHDALTAINLTTCPVTGEVHRSHRAYESDGNIYYNCKLFSEGKKAS